MPHPHIFFTLAGDLSGRGAVFWEALQVLALADPSELVAMEAMRAMLGAPYPRAESSIWKRTGGRGRGVNGGHAMEAMRAMLGAPYPRAEASIRKRTGGCGHSVNMCGRGCAPCWGHRTLGLKLPSGRGQVCVDKV